MTAKQLIINRAKELGYVDNYWAIDNKVTIRLGAVIFALKKEGYDFRTEMHDKNCWYILTKKPEEEKTSLGLVYKVNEPVWR